MKTGHKAKAYTGKQIPPKKLAQQIRRNTQTLNSGPS